MAVITVSLCIIYVFVAGSWLCSKPFDDRDGGEHNA